MAAALQASRSDSASFSSLGPPRNVCACVEPAAGVLVFPYSAKLETLEDSHL